MISVGSRDGRKGLESGSGMEETELEEGEARSYRDRDGDSTVDPDVALSYIGEKLQKYLGHLQKDFEGGVSAENLGAKYGGYGSFLPTYQRSPSFSQTKSPAEVHNYDLPRSPRKLNIEDQRQKPFTSLRASPLARSRDVFGKAVLVEHLLKGMGNLQSNHVEEPVLKSEATKKSAKLSDQRTLKVRIKVGSDNLSTQMNADLYNGLGLVVSPSSSLDDSPTNRAELCGKCLHVPDESPTSILEIMTSYPGELHLSPLPEGLIHLTEKRKLGITCENRHVDKRGIESSGISGNGFHSSKSNQKVLDLKKLKSHGKDDSVFIELANHKNNAFGCKTLVTHALKLPFLSSSQNSIADPAKEVPSEMMLPSNVLKDGVKSDIVSDIVAFTRRDAPGAEKSLDLDHSQSNAFEGRKTPYAFGPYKSSKQLLKEGPASGGGLKPALEKSSIGGKRRRKVAQIVTQVVCKEKDELIITSSLPQKGDKDDHTNGIVSNNDIHHLQKDHQKPGDRYKDIFGDAEFEDDENETDSGEMVSAGMLKDPHSFEKRSLSDDHYTLKGKCDGKTSEKPRHTETRPRVYALLVSPLGNKPSNEAPTGVVLLGNEDWVQCDKCKKWRLLPLGTVPESFPRKWVCRMLNWLPGKNRCSVPQDETTNAIRTLHNPVASVPDSIGTSAEAVPINAKSPNHEHQNSTTVHTAAINEKKANSADFDGLPHSSNSRKKILVASEKISNWNSENLASSQDTGGDLQMPPLSAALKYNDAEEEKISLTNCSGKDTSIKIRNKLGNAVEGSRAYKRIKSEELHIDDNNWHSDNGEPSSKVGCGATSLSNTNTSGRDRCKYIDHKDTSGEAKKARISCSNAEKHVLGTSDDDLLYSGKYDVESVRKRKSKEPSLIHTDPTSSSGRHHPDSGDLVEEFTHQKEKKARVSKFGGKDHNGNNTSVGTDKKGKETKDQHNGQCPSNNQAADCLNSNISTKQPLVAANSSSSKVIGSHKNRISGQEFKGSPDESVCSSPLQPPSAVKVTLNGKNLNGKDGFHDSGFTTVDSSRRISGDGDEERNEQMGTVREDRSATVDDHVTNGDDDKPCISNKYDNVKQASDKCKIEEKSHDGHSWNSGFHIKKSGKELSSHSKDKAWIAGSDTDQVNIKVSDLHEEKMNGRRSKCDEKSGNPSKGENSVSYKDTAGGTSRKNNRGQDHKKISHDRHETENSRDKKHNLQHEHDDNEGFSTKSNQAEFCASRKSNSLPPLARGQAATVDGCDDGDTLKAQNQRRAENQSSQPKRHPTSNSRKVRDAEAPSPLRRESSSHAANNALKEAKDLKHLADRIKNSGSTEGIGLYFQAALKFLHGASLLESGSSETTKRNELMHSTRIYSSTAKLCEFCAREYEKSKDMAAAALAYKCMEVAYMRVVYSSHIRASRDRNELNAVLQIVPSGESPSSSASDVDNLNHPATTDKVALAKAIGSPQVLRSHVITSQSRSGFLRILNFVQDVNFAMEASRKSRIAFTAATSRLGETSNDDGIFALKKALDFNYQDVESLLHLARVAMESISR